MSVTAIVRPVSASLPNCVLTHRRREPIDVALARAQHTSYLGLLSAMGVTIIELPEAPELPDAVFVEDTAVVLPELAVITRPGAAARRPEIPTMAAALAHYRPLLHINAPATLDGGDVLRLGKSLFVGCSARTNEAGVEQLQAALQPRGYDVVPVQFAGCLHLKSAITQVATDALLLNPAWVDAAVFHDYRVIRIDPSEPEAANALAMGGEIIYPAHFPRTAAALRDRGYRVTTIDISELAKAEAGVTCCSVIFEV